MNVSNPYPTSTYNQADHELATEIKRAQAYNANELELSDQKGRRELWQAVFFHELQNSTRTDRITMSAKKADEAVSAYDKQFGAK